jgi:hypothetical protein
MGRRIFSRKQLKRKQKRRTMNRKRRNRSEKRVGFHKPIEQTIIEPANKTIIKPVDTNKPLDDAVVGIVYASWCEHCKEFITKGMEKDGKWAAIIRDLETQGRAFQRLEMESEQRDAMVQNIQPNCPDIAKLADVGFPTIFKIKQNTVHLYDDESRETNAIVAWMCK